MNAHVLKKFDEGTGWYMGFAGPVQLVYIDDRMTDASFRAYLAALERDIDGRSMNANVGIYYHVMAPQIFDSTRRREIAGVLAPRKAKLQICTAGYAGSQ